ncbi:MAG: hypothetical protein JW714_02835, partial [Candidatus Omnitrophica bacterium]|nr:hypothetical protein [Candidatus Omnitrophota bacterium]
EKKITWFKKSFPGQDLAAWMVYFIFLTRRLKLPQLNQLCRDYSFNKQALAKLNFFKKNSKSALKVISSPSKLSTHELYQQLRSFSNEGLLALLCLAPASLAQKRIKLFLKKLSKIRLMIRGEHLKRLGLKPGPRYRQVLRQLLLAKIEGRIASFTDELRLARRLVKN